MGNSVSASDSDEEVSSIDNNSPSSGANVEVPGGLSVYAPTMSDVAVLSRNIRCSQSCILPTVLLLEILSYGFCPLVVKRAVKDALFRGGGNQNEVYLTMTLPPLLCRRFSLIEFEVESKDQGWSSYPDEQGTRTSHTWGEVSLSCTPDERHHVYRNIHAGAKFERQVVPFPIDHDFCQSIKKRVDQSEPQTVQLWLRSLYPGWQQTLRHAEIRVFWHFTEWQQYACKEV